jgi:ribonuclease HII
MIIRYFYGSQSQDVLKKRFQKELIEAGCDEAGRGCLAGPVFAAAVILPHNFSHPLLNDSKQLTHDERDELRPIIERKALAWAVASVDHEEIDRINILKASFKAMHLAVDQLSIRPELLLIDGNRFTPYFGILHHCIVQGDALYRSIAAASILAKTHRDEYMQHIHEEFPHYGWKENKGYGTPYHRAQIKEHGQCIYHRKTFRWDRSEAKALAFDLRVSSFPTL